MANPFLITAQLRLVAGPSVQQVKQEVQSALRNVKAEIQVKLAATSIRQITTLNERLRTLNSNFELVTKGALRATDALNRFSRAAGSVSVNVRNIGSFSKGIDRVGHSARDAGHFVEEFGRKSKFALVRFASFALPVTAIFSISTAFASATKDALDFQNQMVRLAQITGRTQTGVRDTGDEIIRLATKFGVSSAKLSETAVTLAQAGLSATETKTALEALAKTDVSPTFTNLENTTEAAIAVMRQFDVSVGDLGRRLSQISAVSAAYAVESEDLSTAIRKAGGAFKAAGGSFEEFLALFTSIRETTREDADAIATGLRTIFGRLQRPELITFFKDLGVELTNVKGELVGPFQEIQKISDALNQLQGPATPARARIIEELGGLRQLSRVIPLIQQTAKQREILNLANRSANQLDNEAVVAQQSLLRQLVRVREEFGALFKSIATDQSFQRFLKGILDITSATIKLTDALKPVIPVLAALGTAKLLTNVPVFFKGFTARNSGGMIPGEGNTDTVPAMLTPGEYVLRKSAVQRIGVDNLDRINKFAKGGRVRGKGGRFISQGVLENFAVDTGVSGGGSIDIGVGQRPIRGNRGRFIGGGGNSSTNISALTQEILGITLAGDVRSNPASGIISTIDEGLGGLSQTIVTALESSFETVTQEISSGIRSVVTKSGKQVFKSGNQFVSGNQLFPQESTGPISSGGNRGARGRFLSQAQLALLPTQQSTIGGGQPINTSFGRGNQIIGRNADTGQILSPAIIALAQSAANTAPNTVETSTLLSKVPGKQGYPNFTRVFHAQEALDLESFLTGSFAGFRPRTRLLTDQTASIDAQRQERRRSSSAARFAANRQREAEKRNVISALMGGVINQRTQDEFLSTTLDPRVNQAAFINKPSAQEKSLRRQQEKRQRDQDRISKIGARQDIANAPFYGIATPLTPGYLKSRTYENSGLANRSSYARNIVDRTRERQQLQNAGTFISLGVDLQPKPISSRIQNGRLDTDDDIASFLAIPASSRGTEVQSSRTKQEASRARQRRRLAVAKEREAAATRQRRLNFRNTAINANIGLATPIIADPVAQAFAAASVNRTRRERISAGGINRQAESQFGIVRSTGNIPPDGGGSGGPGRRFNLSGASGIAKRGLSNVGSKLGPAGAIALAAGAPLAIEALPIGERGKRGSTGAVGGALAGAAGGSLFGPVGIALGGLVGGIAGFVSSVKDFDKELQDQKLTAAIENIAKTINSQATRFEVNKSFGSVSRQAQNANTQVSFSEQLQDFGGNFGIGLETLKQTFNREGFSGLFSPTQLSFTASQVAGGAISEKNNARTRELQRQLAPAATEAEGVLNQFFSRGGTVKGAEAQFGNLLDVVGTKEGIGTTPQGIRDNGKKVAEGLLKEQQERVKLIDSIAAYQVALNKDTTQLDRLSNTIEDTLSSLEIFGDRSEQTASLFTGGLSRGGVSGAPTIRFGDASFNERLSGLTSNFGEGGKSLLRQGSSLNQITSALPDAIKAAFNDEQQAFASGTGVDKFSFSDAVAKRLPQGLDPTQSNVLSSRIAQLSDAELDTLRSDPQAGTDRLVGDLQKNLEGYIENLQKAVKGFSEFAVEKFQQNQQFIQQVGTEQDKLSGFAVERARLTGRQQAEATGNTALSLVSADVADTPFRDVQTRLSGGQFLDPTQLGNRIRGLTSARDTAQANLSTAIASGDQAGIASASGNFANLDRQLADSIQALKNFTNATELNANVQEQLARINGDSAQRRGIAEGFFGADAKGRVEQLNDIANARLAATEGFDKLDIRQQQSAVRGAGIAGNLLIDNEGTTLRDKINEQLGAAGGGAFAQPVGFQNIGNDLRGREQENLTVAENAQKQLVDILAGQQKQFAADLANTLQGALAGFAGNPEKTLANESAVALAQSLNQFATNSGPLVEAMKAFPHTVELNGQHTVNVVINGQEAFAKMTPEIQKLVTAEVQKGINALVKNRFPDSGPQAPTF